MIVDNGPSFRSLSKQFLSLNTKKKYYLCLTTSLKPCKDSLCKIKNCIYWLMNNCTCCISRVVLGAVSIHHVLLPSTIHSPMISVQHFPVTLYFLQIFPFSSSSQAWLLFCECKCIPRLVSASVTSY